MLSLCGRTQSFARTPLHNAWYFALVLDRSARLARHSPVTAARLRALEAPRRLNDLPIDIPRGPTR